MQLKSARYEVVHGFAGEVLYYVDGHKCVFSGTTPPPNRTSTINAAEEVVNVICAQEGLSSDRTEFYDLQT